MGKDRVTTNFNGSNQVSDEDDFDVEHTLEAVNATMSTVSAGISVSQLTSGGTEFELRQMSHAEADEMEEDKEETDNGWWTQEQLERQLEEDFQSCNPALVMDKDGDRRVDMALLKKSMDVILRSKEGKPLVYKSITFQGYGSPVTDNSTVGYHSVMYLDGAEEPFDSSILRDRPFLSRLNSDLLVPGLRFALTTMFVGEKSMFILDPEVALGELGCPPRVPGNSEILYQVQVLKLYEEGTIGNFLTLPLEEQTVYSFDKLIEMADSERKSGNAYYKDNRHRDAGIRYKRAIQVLESRPCINKDQEMRVKELLLKLYYNTANTSIVLNRPYAAMTYARKALEIDKDNVKALYFYGKAKINTGDYEDARKYLERAVVLKPENPDIIRELQRLNQSIEHDRLTSLDLEKKMAKMFSK